MTWLSLVAYVFGGAFLANAVPHFVSGMMGRAFQTPFAKPPGKGLSSPLVNVLWSLLNLLVGYVLARLGRLASGGDLAIAACFAGVAALSTMCSVNFAKKHPV